MSILTTFLIGFTAGIAATPHCLGMCGGFPLYLTGSDGRRKAIKRIVLFVIGKCFTYAFMGAIAAWLGIIVFKNTSLLPIVPYVRLAAGLVIVALGLSMLGFRLPSKNRNPSAAETGFVQGIFGGILAKPGMASAFVLGLAVGFLPCPLPMGMLALSATNHQVLHGIALLTGVGFGTAPGLLAVGLFGIGLNKKLARFGMQMAAVIVLSIGLLFLGRAAKAIFLPSSSTSPPPCCCGEQNK